jgi:hypothetical protein
MIWWWLFTIVASTGSYYLDYNQFILPTRTKPPDLSIDLTKILRSDISIHDTRYR